jgi:acyl carrier protein
MKKVEFFKALHEILEIESVPSFDENTDLKSLDEYSSLTIMIIIAFIDDNFSTKLTASQLNSITTVKSLMELVGIDKFSE